HSRRLRSSRPGSRGLLDLLPHECFPVATLDSKARHGIECRRGDRFTRAQAETGMMPGTSHGVADDQPLCERSTVMGAGRSDREQLITAAHEEYRVIPDMPTDHPSIRHITEGNALGEIRSLRF